MSEVMKSLKQYRFDEEGLKFSIDGDTWLISYCPYQEQDITCYAWCPLFNIWEKPDGSREVELSCHCVILPLEKEAQ